MSTLSIQQAAKLTGVGQDRLRDMMRDGTLKGVISPGGKRFRPSIYSLFVDLLHHPPDVAMKMASEAVANVVQESQPSRPATRNHDELLERVRERRKPEKPKAIARASFMAPDHEEDEYLVEFRRKTDAALAKWRAGQAKRRTG